MVPYVLMALGYSLAKTVDMSMNTSEREGSCENSTRYVVGRFALNFAIGSIFLAGVSLVRQP